MSLKITIDLGQVVSRSKSLKSLISELTNYTTTVSNISPISQSFKRQAETDSSIKMPSEESTEHHDKDKPLWIFGYGSLIWKTNFPFSEKCVGYIRNYSRKFWQGSTDHRGVPGKPGRVVTLIEEDKATTWGMAYQVLPKSVPEVMAYLDHREKGGYTLHNVKFHPKDDATTPFMVYVYIATQDNEEFLGEATLEEIAKQIATSCGPSGKNSEYLLNLAMAVRELGVHDDHIFELEKRVTDELINNTMLSSESS